MSKGPAIRGLLARSTLEHIERLGDETASAVRTKVGLETWSAIANADALGWVPIELDVAVTEALDAQLDGPAYDEFWRALLLSTLDSSLLDKVTNAAISFFGRNPDGLVYWTPRGWEICYRGCGSMRARATTPQRAQLIWEDIPPQIQASPAWVQGVAGAFGAFAGFADSHGTVRTDLARLAAGQVTFDLVWAPKQEPHR